jgi:5'-nucleotidase
MPNTTKTTVVRPTILVTNDDGVYSPGLLALKQQLEQIAEVIVLAPERNWSATSHSKTMHKPLRVQPVVLADGSAAHASSGSPTDCVALAIGGVLGKRPDLVVSGINLGHNLGIDVTYSGTVACAMEAVIKGVPGIAVSGPMASQLEASQNGPAQNAPGLHAIHQRTAEIAAEVALQTLARGLPHRTLLNINVPVIDPAAWRGLHVTRMGQRDYPEDELIERFDPYGRPYYWLGGSMPLDALDDGTDVGAVANGFVSVTPIMLDLTHHAFLADLATWEIGQTEMHALGVTE